MLLRLWANGVGLVSEHQICEGIATPGGRIIPSILQDLLATEQEGGTCLIFCHQSDGLEENEPVQRLPL